ncbi:non-hydrolyzing UDP-N-acetylglucosamine 2-epimerase [Vagococcus hydrophili]|uniref:UDP-N-acetylglucosamine 2-epimerase (non-hydrolyzing) n=1 Tax=Vagococcus hydrophili TaxID=2714947 RepID=A0A6G8AR80_9ENTE|nr:UDP-N-acetylglucosamine 2-epimerase (non-hydrolyzing) [Vagococcus hydrophili]QIL47435.1 UDP-N-acetylglucosamine 2-epimerase (non-hydrolyzing) [Vagococcus hydrophili]
MQRKKILSIFGTRPEAIKMAPVIKELEKRSDEFESVVVVTAQQREMLDQVLTVFNIKPDYDLNIMQPNQTLAQLTSRVLMKLDPILEVEKPDVVLVHGDTTTSFVASLAAFYHQIKIGHVEAGLRTWDKYAPYPEEMNRQMTDCLSDIYFAPTVLSKANLLQANVPEEKIFVTGNTVVDALQQTTKHGFSHEITKKWDPDSKKVLLTCHRRENFGKPMEQVFKSVIKMVETYSDLEVIYPVHPNPNVKKQAEEMFKNQKRIHLIDPLDVIDFHNCMSECYFIMSDSGGVQEEAPSLGKPVLVLREVTERPEGLETGILKLVGTCEKTILNAVEKLMMDSEYYQSLTKQNNPYGDGYASIKIVNLLNEQ